MPRDFITDDGFGITDKCRRYLPPLIEGEDYPPYKNGLPVYVTHQGRGGEEEAQHGIQALMIRAGWLAAATLRARRLRIARRARLQPDRRSTRRARSREDAARNERKLVIVCAGGAWCGPCRRLHDFMKTTRPLPGSLRTSSSGCRSAAACRRDGRGISGVRPEDRSRRKRIRAAQGLPGCCAPRHRGCSAGWHPHPITRDDDFLVGRINWRQESSCSGRRTPCSSPGTDASVARKIPLTPARRTRGARLRSAPADLVGCLPDLPAESPESRESPSTRSSIASW